MYFSKFEPINLTPDNIMQQAGVPMLYDLASNLRLPCLYICPIANVMGEPPSFNDSVFHWRQQLPHNSTVFHTASRTVGVLEAPQPTRSWTGVTAAGSTR